MQNPCQRPRAAASRSVTPYFQANYGNPDRRSHAPNRVHLPHLPCHFGRTAPRGVAGIRWRIPGPLGQPQGRELAPFRCGSARPAPSVIATGRLASFCIIAPRPTPLWPVLPGTARNWVRFARFALVAGPSGRVAAGVAANWVRFARFAPRRPSLLSLGPGGKLGSFCMIGPPGPAKLASFCTIASRSGSLWPVPPGTARNWVRFARFALVARPSGPVPAGEIGFVLHNRGAPPEVRAQSAIEKLGSFRTLDPLSPLTSDIKLHTSDYS
jgi:hypothetical protein